MFPISPDLAYCEKKKKKKKKKNNTSVKNVNIMQGCGNTMPDFLSTLSHFPEDK